MKEEKHTSTGMVKISKEILESIVARYNKRGMGNVTDWGKHLMEVKERMMKEDPHLAAFLDSQSMKYPPEIRKLYFEGAIELYSLLESQVEANKLDR